MRQVSHCRACGGAKLELVFDFGNTPLANGFIIPGQQDSVKTYPLRFAVCSGCSLGQLLDVVPAEELYLNYNYVSSTSRTLSDHLDCLIADIKRPSRVLEIASNTGVFLSKFQKLGCNVLGVDPAENISKIAIEAGIPTMIEFFDRDSDYSGFKPDLIIGRHVLAHIDDWAGLLEGLNKTAGKDTDIMFEVPYLLDLYHGKAFDTIYHEHLSYISCDAINAWLKGSPFYLHHAKRYPIHGGSIVYHIKRRSGKEVEWRDEQESVLHLKGNWEGFKDSIETTKKQFKVLFESVLSVDSTKIGYGASARGNSLMSMCGINRDHLDYVIDNTQFKQGKLTPNRIPIMPPSKLLEDVPDYAIVLAWTFYEEIVARESEYQNRGGRFIVPFPFRILDYNQ
jgi:SAM-dependent methyltransferase